MDADYRRNSKRLRDEIAAEGGMQWDGRPEDMVRTRLRAFRQLAPRCASAIFCSPPSTARQCALTRPRPSASAVQQLFRFARGTFV